MSDGRPWTFADYKIRDILDVDLVSTTYRATTIDGDVRRLRVFTAEVASDKHADAHAAVITEARRTRRVRHPHILATHDVGRSSDRVYVVSDDINGVALRDFIAQRQPLEPGTALAMGWQLAEALDAVHASGNVHGSINPHTIWVADSPGSNVPMTYLTGFGSAQALAQYIKDQDGAPVCDDLLYVGPDQMRDQRPSPEADRYALACAVYHLMTGAPPYRRGSINALFGAHLFASVEPATAVRVDLPPALDSVFLRALAKQTSDRYPSAYALMIAVERALRGQREQAAPRPPERGDAGSPAGYAQPASGSDVPGVAEPTFAEPDIAEPDIAEPGTAEPGIAEPGTAEPGIAEPGIAEPGTAEPGISGDDAEPGISGDDAEPGIPDDDAESTRPLPPAQGGRPPRPSTALRASSDGSHAWAPGRRPQWVAGPDLAPAHAAPPNGSATVATTAAGMMDDTGTLDDVNRPAGQVAEPAADEAASAPEPAVIERNGTSTAGEPDMLEGTGTLGAPDVAKDAERAAEPAGGVPRAGGLADRLEARRTARDQADPRPHREQQGDAHPPTMLPPRPPPAAQEAALPRGWRPPLTPRFAGPELAKLWTSARRLLETRRGVVMLVAGVLVIAVIATVAAAALRGGTGNAGTQSAAGRSGSDTQPDDDSRPATIRPRWTTSFAHQPVELIRASDEAVLVAAGTTVGALEPSSGAQLWSHRTLADVTEVEVLLDVMVVRTRNRISAYDVTTGALRWTVSGEAANVDAIAASREHLYAVARDSGGFAVSEIDPADGDVTSLTTIGNEGVAPDRAGRATVAVDPSARKDSPTLYVLTRAALHALEPHDGSVRWSAPVSGGDRDAQGGQDSQASQLLARPWVDSLGLTAGASFVVGRDGSVCRYASDSGELVWTMCETFPAELARAPTLEARGGRVLVSSSDAVAAYDLTTGKLLWGQDRPPQAVASGSKLAYVAQEDGRVEAIDHRTGRVQWRAQDAGDVTALVADDEGIYVGAADGSVVRLLEQNVAKADVQ